jgi:hypothetical protein
MNDDSLDSLLQRAREHRAPAWLWPVIAARAQTHDPGHRWQRRTRHVAALLIGAIGYLLIAAALVPRGSRHTPDAAPTGLAAIVLAAAPYFGAGGAPAAAVEQRLLQQLSEEARSHR